MTLDAAKLSMLVLCGGGGRRMGGQDKPLLNWQGHAMIDHILATVPYNVTKYISANRNLDQYARRGELVTDEAVLKKNDLDATGPLVGILGGLQACRTPWLLIAPGDTPNLPADWASRLWQVVQNNATHAVVHDGERQQHLHLLLHQSVQDALLTFLRGERHEVYRWLELISPSQVLFTNPSGFLNINTPEQLRAQAD